MGLWWATPAGRYQLAWEQARLDAVVGNIFGFHALQLGVPQLQALAANRMPHRWLAEQATVPRVGPAPDLLCDFAALPFPANSLDLVVLPHTLEFSADPHATLREVERVLVPEGKLVVTGFNPVSLWGWRQRRAHLWQRLGWGELFLPPTGEFLSLRRLRDWLQLLSFEAESVAFGCYRPALRSDSALARMAWMDALGPRWWPIFGATYVVVAVKRVRGLTLLSPAWKSPRRLAGAPVSVANCAPGADRESVHEHG
jgi:SAM-dependent methyltransferase